MRPSRLRAVAVLICVATLDAGLAARRVPDFSGTWTVDLDRSKGASPANANVTIVIKQDAKTLTIEQQGIPTVVYHLDGTPSKNVRVGRGGDAIFTSVWQGDRLVTTVENGQPGQKETRYLEDGEMVEIAELKSALGPTFVRKLYWKRVSRG